MADVTYTVEVQYLTKGNLFDGITRNASGFTQSIRRMEQTFIGSMSNSFGSLFTQNFRQTINNRILPEAQKTGASFGDIFGANMLSGLALSGIETAFTGMVHALKVGLFDVNAEIEQLSITLATSFAGTGQVKDFEQGMQASAAVIKQMRRDARELPGEFKDLASIMQRINTPAANAGMSIQDTELLAASAMARGVGNRMPADVVGREIGDFIQGNVRKNQPMLKFLLNMKLDPHTLNSMDQTKRIEVLRKSLGMIEGTREHAAAMAERKAFMHSWVGLSSTFKDNARTFLGAISESLFESIKGSLDKFNDWFDANQDKIVTWAKSIGHHLGQGFNKALDTAMKLTRIAERVEKALSGGEGARLGSAGEMTRTGGTLAALGIGSQAFMWGSRAVSAAGTAAGAEGTGLMAAIGGISAGPLLAVALAIGGVIEGLSNDLTPLHGDMVALWNALKVEAGDAFKHLKASLMAVWPIIKRVAEMFGETLLAGLVASLWVIEKLAIILEIVVVGFTNLLGILRDFIRKLPLFNRDEFKFLDPDAKAKTRDIKSFDRDLVPVNIADLPDAKKPPTHNTTIHRVEIHVNSNQDPNRIARRTVDVLNDMVRHPNAYYRAGIPRLST